MKDNLYNSDFQLFIDVNSVKKKDVAEFLNVSQAFITQLTQGSRAIPSDKLALLKQNNNWDTSMLCEGVILKSEEKVEIIEKNITAGEAIPLLPISAQGGSLNDFAVSIQENDCERIISPIAGVDFAISIAGDSMSPEYPSGSQVLVKRINERAFIEWGKVYVLDTCNGSIIKTLMPAENPDSVKCVSINERFPPFEVSKSDINGIYRVLMLMAIK